MRGGAMNRLYGVLLLISGSLVSGCRDGVSLPPPKGPPLTVSGGGPSARSTAPLSVLYVSPEGQLARRHTQATVVFSQPMVALGRADKQAQLAPLRVEPSVEGEQRWIDSRTLLFQPKGGFAGSTSYRLSVPKGIKSLSGRALAAGRSWSFTTPRLAVTASAPHSGFRHAKPGQSVVLRFNQRVSAAAVARRASFFSRGAQPGAKMKRIAVDCKPAAKPKNFRGSALQISPRRPLPLNSRVILRIRGDLRGEEGPEPMGEDYLYKMSTYGPLRVALDPCRGPCDPDQGVTLRFSNPVSVRRARRAVRLNGQRIAQSGGDYFSTRVHLFGRRKARARYSVVIVGSIKDRFGQSLRGTRRFSFHTGDYRPTASIDAESGVLEPTGPSRLSVALRNVKSASVRKRWFAANEVARLLGSSRFSDTSRSALTGWRGVSSERLELAEVRNQRSLHYVALDRAAEQQVEGPKPRARGVLMVELAANLGKQGRVLQRRLLRITDLAVTGKYSPHASLLWLTSLSTGRPVGGAAVSLWRPGAKKALWRGRTDDNGLASGPGTIALGLKRQRELIFVAETARDMSFVRASHAEELSPWVYGYNASWDEGGEALLGLIFSDRGIYRAGETVQLKGILRRRGAKALKPAQGQVKVAVSDSRSETVLEKTLNLNRFGAFHLPLKLSADARLGSYTVRVEMDKKTLHESFQVEAYRPAEFAVSVKPERRTAIRGEKLSWSGSGRYLFGGAMRGATFRRVLFRRRAHFVPPKHQGFAFSDALRWWAERQRPSRSFVGEVKGKLDRSGGVKQTVEFAPKQMTGPDSYTLELSVSDVSRQSIADRSKILVHPGEYYIGIKPEQSFLTAGDKLRADIVAVTPDGRRLERVDLQGTLYRRQWRSVRKKGIGSGHSFITRPVETAVGRCRIRTAAQARRCSLLLAKAGNYVLRLRGSDQRGNPIMSSIDVYATGGDYVAWRREEGSKLELVLDRQLYRPGDKARILIKSPFRKAHGLLTVESNGIQLRRAIELRATAAEVELPVTAEMLPNAYVSVMLVRGRVRPWPKRGDADPGKPSFKVGYAEIKVDQSSQRLRLSVRPQVEAYQPGQTAVVNVTVRDKQGRPAAGAELTVIAADEGVLSLIAYQTPDPMAIFYAPRALSVRTLDSRLRLIQPGVFGQKGGNAGGGGGGRGGATRGGFRENFVSTAYFNPSLLTDARGRATVRFKLPDNLTTFRIMAVANTVDSRFGSAAAKIRVSKPLLLLPSLPRHVRVGDRFEAGVVVHNNTVRASRAEVSAAVNGLLMVGPASAKLQVAGGGAKEARFRFVAQHPGKATFRFQVHMGKRRDGLKLERPIGLPTVVETVATSGSTETSAVEGLLPRGVRQDVGGLDLTLASTALVGLKPSVEYLLDYPYECLEQTTSRLVPLVLLGDITRGYQLRQRGEIARLVRKLISKIEGLQRWDGGFSYFQSGHRSVPWASAYAAWGLWQARSAGYPVGKGSLKRAQAYLEGQLRRRNNGASHSRDLQAYLTYVLTLMGAQVHDYRSTLYEKREQLATFGRALLLASLARAKAESSRIRDLERELLGRVHQSGQIAKVEEGLEGRYASYFHSDLRASAMVLSALLATSPKHPLVDKLARYLVQQRRNGRWSNTQETVYALLGLHRYHRVRERQPPNFVADIWLGRRKLGSRAFQGRAFSAQRLPVPMARLAAAGSRLGFIKRGAGTLHYSAQLRYARLVLPKEPWSQGILITRHYEALEKETQADSGSGPPGIVRRRRRVAASDGPAARQIATGRPLSQIAAGQVVRVVLRIVVPQQMQFVVVDDPLPAGLEPINLQLMTAQQRLRRHSNSPWYTPFYHRELHDDRVLLFADEMPAGDYRYVYLARATTLGDFVVPAAHAEKMYEPSVFGRTAATRLSVR